jgi:hypothetical protein
VADDDQTGSGLALRMGLENVKQKGLLLHRRYRGSIFSLSGLSPLFAVFRGSTALDLTDRAGFIISGIREGHRCRLRCGRQILPLYVNLFFPDFSLISFGS